MDLERIKRRIRGLLALGGNNDSEAQAQTALDKAHELMVEHGIVVAELEAETEEWATEEVFEGKRFSSDLQIVSAIVAKFFFVEALITKTRRAGFSFTFFGRPDHVATALTVFKYLSATFSRLWLERKRESGWSMSAKTSYYVGLYKGFTEKLKVRMAQNERALIPLDRARKAAFFWEVGPTHQTKSLRTRRDDEARDRGFLDGGTVEAQPLLKE